MKCNCCQREVGINNYRMGYCFDCIDCESVIVEGLDMWDKEIDQPGNFSMHMAKLHYILKKFGVVKNQ